MLKDKRYRMNSLEQQITSLAKSAVKALYGVEAEDSQIQLQKTRPEFEGNITLVVFPFVKTARKAPQAVAQEIGEWIINNQMVNNPMVNGFNAVQGFLNLTISDSFWVEQLKAINADENYGRFNRPSNAPSLEGRDGEGFLTLTRSGHSHTPSWQP